MTVVETIGTAMLGIGATLTMIRLARGPSVLDRIVALDIITNVLIIAVALAAAVDRRTDTVPVLAALALVGFVSSVVVARFASVEPQDAGRIKTYEEVRAEDEARLKAEQDSAVVEAEIAASRDQEIGP